MVLQKSLDYGFNGYEVPPIPRATRSVRRRGSFKKKVEDNQVCAFDLLAIVAGNLLQEKESTPSSSNTSAGEDQCMSVNNTVKNTWQADEKSMEVEAHDQQSPDRASVSELVSRDTEQNSHSNDINLGSASTAGTSGSVGKPIADNLVNGKSENNMDACDNKVEVGCCRCRECDDCKLDGEANILKKDKPQKPGNVLDVTVADMCSFEDPVVWDGKPPALLSSNSTAKMPLCGNYVSHCSYPTNRDDVIVDSRDDDETSSGCTHPSTTKQVVWDGKHPGLLSSNNTANMPLCGNHVSHCSYPTNQDDVIVDNRDDDENSSGCTHHSTTKQFFRPSPRIGDRRIRKILASKYWKVAPRLKEPVISNTDGDSSPIYHKRKNFFKCQRSDRLYPFKKRKHFGYGSLCNSEGGINREFFSDLSKKGNDGDAAGSCPNKHGVKLRIKSFKIPELFIEIPESATVGLLKRTVMEAMMTTLGGGLRVGVLLQGRKVRDDSKTLLQTGIACNNKLDALGFSLEPNPSHIPPSLNPGDSSYLLSCDTPQPLSRYPSVPNVLHQAVLASASKPRTVKSGNFIESDHDSAPSSTNMPIDNSTIDSKALVPVSEMNVDALAVVLTCQKSNRSEIVQRRIRRPFSIAEVEALVQAVEKLGTGRWRDVKLQAFDNAKHRTYVDLKDKWKTLVHTATISPQHRRGEAVPQELLDRVLTTQAYWSQAFFSEEKLKLRT